MDSIAVLGFAPKRIQENNQAGNGREQAGCRPYEKGAGLFDEIAPRRLGRKVMGFHVNQSMLTGEAGIEYDGLVKELFQK